MPRDLPNLVLLVGEDTGRHLGCYGDPAAHTPNLDRLAARGARYTHAFTHSPVCAPSRAGLVTGCYPTTFGAHHMRSTALNPPPMFTRWLRDAGYHVSWPGKTDFNFQMNPQDVTDTEPWIGRELPRAPFFVYHNFGVTHESSMWADDEKYRRNTSRLAPDEFHDPADMTVPPYLPDTPEARRDIARHYDHVTQLDHEVGDVLPQLDEAGFADDTIVVFLADHGRGTPRSKRWLYDLGTHMPLLIRSPGRIEPGTVDDRMVAWVDLAPTLLSLVGITPPEHMQGVPFLGPAAHGVEPRRYCFMHRGRMDEQYDHVLAARDARFRYIRNRRPDLPWSQRNHYMEQLETMRVWRERHAAGRLNATQAMWFSPTKPAEELYDCEADPFEVRNLADSPEHRGKLEELRAALDGWVEGYLGYAAMDERELVRRGVVADRMEEYMQRVEPLPEGLQPAGGPWDMFGEPWRAEATEKAGPDRGG